MVWGVISVEGKYAYSRGRKKPGMTRVDSEAGENLGRCMKC